jgi:uncharacterized membrane protein
MLVTLPIGLWVFSFVCDLVYLAMGWGIWAEAAFLAVGGGIVGAAMAAVPGLIDLWTLRQDNFRAGLVHMTVNVMALFIYTLSFFARWIGASMSLIAPLSVIGVVVLAVGGWLGGELVFVRRIGVSEQH